MVICRIPHLCGEYLCIVVLNHTVGIGWYTFALSSMPVNTQLVQIPVIHCLLRQIYLPVAILVDPLKFELRLLDKYQWHLEPTL
jgi:hypothetical protein